jgi:hypothetical protein
MIAGMLSTEADSGAAHCPCERRASLALAAVHARRPELAAVTVLAAGLLAARGLGLDALAVWCASGLLLLLPGWLAVRALGLEGELGLAGCAPVAAALGVALWGVPLALAFVFTLPLGFVLAGLAAELAALAAVIRGPCALPAVGRRELAGGAAGVVAFAYLGWRLSLPVVGDGLFHVGLIRKLESTPGISFASLSPFLHGPANAGYAFPIMHAAMAGMARLSGTDPVTTFRDVQPVCAGLAILAAYALGRALTGRAGVGVLAAVLVAWDLCSLLNGLVIQINQPAPFSVWVLTPAVLILFLLELRPVRRAAPATVAALLSIALVHPTYAIPALVLAAGLLLGAVLAGGRTLRGPVRTLAVSTAVIGAVSVWIWAIAIRGGHRHAVLSHADEFLLHGKRALVMYPWAPVFGRGYVLAAILLLPLVARHRRLLPLAGSAAALLLMLLVPGVNTVLITAVGMGQFHRFWQPLTWPVVAAAAACMVAARLRLWAYPLALVIAVGLHEERGVTWVWHTPTSVLVVCALLALPLALRWRAAGAPVLAVSPGAVALVAAVLAPWVWHWGPVVRDSAEAGPYRAEPAFETVRITPGVAAAFRRISGPPPVVLGDPQRLFELFAFADIRAAVLPEARTRAVPKLDEQGRNHLEQSFFSLETTTAQRNAILARMHVSYVLLDLRDQPPDVLARIVADPALTRIYLDPADVPDHLGRFEILRVNAATADRSAAGSPAGRTTA